MKARTIIWGVGMIAFAFSIYKNDLAAAYIAFGATVISWAAHAIEFKINRLLEHYGITVTHRDVDQSY